MRNLFCDHSDLRNEADVEQNFVRRLIETLGYSDKVIRPKGHWRRSQSEMWVMPSGTARTSR